MTAVSPTADLAPRPFSALDYGLYAITVFAWGTSWIALKMQLGTVAPEVSVLWRFCIAAALMLLWTLVTRRRLAFSAADHLHFVALGLMLFSTNFVLFYHGGKYLASGLLSVVFSLASVFNILLSAIFLRQRIEGRVIVGAVLGAAGIGAMFLPEIRGQAFNQGALVGLAFCIAGTLSFCLGNLVSWSAQRRGLPVVSTNAWGMVYGAILLALYCLLRGLPLQVDWSVRYLGSLLWLSLTASVVAFATYLTLLGRIGSGRAGYATVMFPVVALAISAAVEGYHPGLLAALGLLLVLGGNALVLSRRS